MDRRSIFNEEEAAKTGAHGGPEETAHVEQSGATRVAPRAARDTSYPKNAGAQRRRMSTKVHRTTRAQARDPGRRNNELANDVRVSPTDEGAGIAGGGVTRGTTTPDCSQWISSVVTPNSTKSTSLQSKPRSPCTECALRGRAVPGRPPPWRTWGRCCFLTCVR